MTTIFKWPQFFNKIECFDVMETNIPADVVSSLIEKVLDSMIAVWLIW